MAAALTRPGYIGLDAEEFRLDRPEPALASGEDFTPRALAHLSAALGDLVDVGAFDFRIG